MTPLEQKLYGALVGVFGLIEDGTLVRDISDDAKPEWVIRMVNMATILKKAKDVIEEADQKSR